MDSTIKGEGRRQGSGGAGGPGFRMAKEYDWEREGVVRNVSRRETY